MKTYWCGRVVVDLGLGRCPARFVRVCFDQRRDLDERVVRLVEEGEEVERSVEHCGERSPPLSNTLTTWNSPAANAPASSSEHAGRPRRPAGTTARDGSSCSQPSATSCSSTASASVPGSWRRLDDVGYARGHRRCRALRWSCSTVCPATGAHDASGPCRPMPYDPPRSAHEEQPPGERGEARRGSRGGRRGWCQDQVDAAAEHGHRDDRDEDAAELGLPADRQQCRHHRLRTYSTMALICSSVSRLPKPGMRPVPWPLRAVALAELGADLMKSIMSSSLAKWAFVDAAGEVPAEGALAAARPGSP